MCAKIYPNVMSFGKVTAKNWIVQFFGTQCISLWMGLLLSASLNHLSLMCCGTWNSNLLLLCVLCCMINSFVPLWCCHLVNDSDHDSVCYYRVLLQQSFVTAVCLPLLYLYCYAVLYRDTLPTSSADVLGSLDLVRDLSVGFDTSVSISSGTQSSAVSATGMLLLLAITYNGVLLNMEVGIHKRGWHTCIRYTLLIYDHWGEYMLSKNPEVGVWRIPAYTPQYTSDYTTVSFVGMFITQIFTLG